MELSQLAVPSVYVLISFLGYPSQWLLMRLEPRPLTKNEIIFSNIILVLIFITYTKSVFVDPGTIPKDWAEKLEQGASDKSKEIAAKSRKWCRKCDAPKPPRAHHCKACKRCIPKMDHHCPWTANCVSYITFPHFLRFLLYTTTGLTFLQSLLFTRLHHLWTARDLPAYLGPSPFLLFHLFATLLTNTITLFAVGLLALRNLYTLAINTTTIEGWEIERHRTLVRRARHFNGYLEAPDGSAIRIKKQEFPYDIGFAKNVFQAMGSRNPLQWLNPLAPSPTLLSGLVFESNGFEDETTTWPPPDPDRNYRRREKSVNQGAFVYENENLNVEETLAAFKARQARDVVRRRKPFGQRIEEKIGAHGLDLDREYGYGEEYAFGDDASDAEEDEREKYGEGEGEEGWRNAEGERLQDFGVDEDVEFYDEQQEEEDDDDNVPLAELIARRARD